MRGALTVGTTPGPRAEAWEALVSPRAVWIAEDDGAAVGSVSMAERWTRVGDEPVRWGYFGELHVAPEARRRGVAMALTFAGIELERTTTSRFVALVTLGGNRAIQTLLSRRPDLPPVVPLARMHLIQWLTLRAPDSRSASSARTARPDDLPSMHALLDHGWRQRALAPAMSLDELATAFRSDPSMGIHDAVVVERGGAIVGCGALWDQRDLRREVVLRYGFPLSIVASMVRAYAERNRAPSLPPVGNPLPMAHVRFFAAVDLAAARAVRDALLARARERGLLLVMLGLDERDPLAEVRKGTLRVTLPGTLWVGRDTDGDPAEGLAGRIAHVDYSLV